jgi:tRNA G18 (ribose-2'-O)-methylase SpoU
MVSKMLVETTCQICGADAISAALSCGRSISLVLVAKEDATEAALTVAALARDLGIEVRTESRADLWRMNQSSNDADILALVDRNPSDTLDALMRRPGLIWHVSGAEYPTNVGVIIRNVEVSGAAGVIIAGDFNLAARKRAVRVSMRANRFLPVLWESTAVVVEAARAAKRQIVGVEDSGKEAPWAVDFARPALCIVGGEHDGIAPEVLAACSTVIRLPMRGFIPSYNVHTAVAMVTAEYLRQTG